MRVYLCGPMTGLSRADAQVWRRRSHLFLRKRGIITLDPTRKSTLHLDQEFDAGGDHTNPLATSKALTVGDRTDIMRSDLVLANFTGATSVSLGSSVELGWADAYRKPVCLVMEAEGNPHDHGMVEELATWRYTNLDEALEGVTCILNWGDNH